MNRIIDAKRQKFNCEIAAKNFEILVGLGQNEGKVIVVPPMNTYAAADFEGISLTLESALLPFTAICEIYDDGAIAFAASEAVKYFESGEQVVLSALGDLIVAYITQKNKREYSPAVELVRAEIEKSVSDCGFSLKDYLKSLPLNSEYLRKLFKKEMGISPKDYLLGERMKLAMQLLSGGAKNKFSEYSVSQIAEACGFSEPLYFSRVFKKYFGVSPTEYKPNA